MPEECKDARDRLVMEYNRLMAWGKAAGLVEVRRSSSVWRSFRGSVLGASGSENIPDRKCYCVVPLDLVHLETSMHSSNDEMSKPRGWILVFGALASAE